MKVRFHHIERNTPTIATLFFEPEASLRYEPGQFADFHIPDFGHRIFTLTSLPEDTLLSIVVRFPFIASPYKQVLLKLMPGDTLTVDEPLGDFVLPKDTSVRLVWAAGGVGSAAFLGMAKSLARQGVHRSVTLLQSARTSDELLFTDSWHKAGVAVEQRATRDEAWAGRTGHITAQDLFDRHDTDHETMFYISGPESMVEELASGLQSKGIRTDYIVREAFTGYY